MKLYLAKGAIWCGTQADAKAAQGGNDYEHVEVPTDKPSLLEWLNANWSPPEHAEEASVDLAESDDAADDYVDARKVAEVFHGHPIEPRRNERHIHEAMEGGEKQYCARCGRTAQGYKWLAAGDTLEGIRSAIDTLEERYQLNAVIDAVEDRGKVLQFTEETT